MHNPGKDLSAQHWIAGLRAQRLKNAETVAQNEAVIIEAMDAIDAVNEAAMKRADVLDFDWTEKRVAGIEGQLLMNLHVAQEARQRQPDPSEAEDQLLSTVIPIDTGTSSADDEEDSGTPAGSRPAADTEADGSVPREAAEAPADDDSDDDGWGGF
jgi:hypothetical protein